MVFSTSGTAADPGRFDVHNLTMPGARGLTGTRHYSTAEGDFHRGLDGQNVDWPARISTRNRNQDVTWWMCL